MGHRIRCLAFAAALAGLASPALAATTIDTTGSWDGSSFISPFGTGSTGVYGETITAPSSDLTSFTFFVNDGGNALNVVGEVFAWSGALTAANAPQGATGPAVFTGADFTISGVNGFQAVTVNTPGATLTAGDNYVLLLADTGGDLGTGLFGDIATHPGVSGDGGFNFDNNLNDLSAINTGAWDDTIDFGSLAFTADFGAVPEPATWGMMLVGFFGLGAILRNRRSQRLLPA